MNPTAFQASFSDFRLVKGRKVCQLIFEVPIEQADSALSVLGGIPNPEHSIWVGIARISLNQKAKPKLPSEYIWRASSECAMLCKEKSFQKFMGAASEEIAIDRVRGACDVESRTEFDRNSEAAMRWQNLKQGYEIWYMKHGRHSND
jgi:hypothetical protein